MTKDMQKQPLRINDKEPKPKSKALCYLKINRKETPIYKYIMKFEKYCYENYEIIEWYIDIIDDNKMVTPSFLRLMKDIATCHNLCDVVVTLNENQFSLKPNGIQVCKNIFKNTGIEWLRIENSNACWSTSIIDAVNEPLQTLTKTMKDSLDREIDKIKDELYME